MLGVARGVRRRPGARRRCGAGSGRSCRSSWRAREIPAGAPIRAASLARAARARALRAGAGASATPRRSSAGAPACRSPRAPTCSRRCSRAARRRRGAVRPGERIARIVAVGAARELAPGTLTDILITRDGPGGAARTRLALRGAEVVASAPAPRAPEGDQAGPSARRAGAARDAAAGDRARRGAERRARAARAPAPRRIGAALSFSARDSRIARSRPICAAMPGSFPVRGRRAPIITALALSLALLAGRRRACREHARDHEGHADADRGRPDR